MTKRALTPNPNHAIAKGAGAKTGDLASDLNDDPDTLRILQDLRSQMGTHNEMGQPISPQARAQAQQSYLAIRAGAQNRATEKHDAELRARETEVRAQAQLAEARAKEAAAEAERARVGLEAERLRIDEDRVEIEKGRLLVEVLEKIGSNPALLERFGPLADQMGIRLLAGPSPEAVVGMRAEVRALTDKVEEARAAAKP